MPKGPVVVVAAVAGVLFLGSAAALIFLAQRGTPDTSGGMTFGPSSAKSGASGDPLAPDPNLTDLKFLPFELTDQNGQPATNAVFTGKLTIVDFIFTNCPLACPTLTGRLTEVAARVSDPRLQFLSISVDPDRDTPEKLKKYAEGFGADPHSPRWRLLRGDREATWKLVHDGIKFKIGEDESTPITLADGTSMLNIRHPLHLVLVGPKGEILGLYLGTRDEDVEALVERVQRALKKL